MHPNRMKMHPAKTKYSIISTRQKIANSAKQSLDLSVDGMQLTKVESERVLGVYIDSHLTWNEHIDTLRRKLLQRIAILARAWKYIPTKYRLLLYNASIKPLFTYCCTVWSNCSQTNLDELFKLQKRCARLILDSPRDARSYDNFQKLKWLPVDQLFKVNKLSLLKKVIDNRAPEYLITTLDNLDNIVIGVTLLKSKLLILLCTYQCKAGRRGAGHGVGIWLSLLALG